MGPSSFPFLAVLCLLSMDAKQIDNCVPGQLARSICILCCSNGMSSQARHCVCGNLGLAGIGSSGDACIGFDCAHWVFPSRDDAWLAWAEVDINPSRAKVNDLSF